MPKKGDKETRTKLDYTLGKGGDDDAKSVSRALSSSARLGG